jgi:hypothetical protein
MERNGRVLKIFKAAARTKKKLLSNGDDNPNVTVIEYFFDCGRKKKKRVAVGFVSTQTR